ncbi:RHS repeat-associated core domain-containing protein [Dyadobacter sp. CY312]|uniref:RHS repeat-associated core domain-containing protein n=1 Tax=Dyadobacter sp. CY312 TaxID=2907303 RepID=UPI001F167AC0|nr:RHS repeat-associated core domain-containing protein [Dyadobacter sp. CY312]MCE7043814.1 RHS repeat-associated core domain-containing protein [Dyadobacter sp. CY312]
MENTLLTPTASTGLPVWLYRGYTGHEHLDRFGLINMNGRMYDPVLGRMLSPDNYVADAGFSQDYNRYTYARNNPLIYTDPDGNMPWITMAIGAVIGGIVNGVAYDMQGKGFFDGFWRGAIAGAIGGLTGYYAPVAGAIPGSLYGAGTGAVTGGVGAALNGNNVWKGMAWGAAFGGVSGGIVGYINGNKLGINPWTGTGVASHALRLDQSTGNGQKWNSTDEMVDSYNSTIGSRDGMSIRDIENKLNTTVHLGDNYSLSKGYVLADGNMYWDGDHVGGVTTQFIKGGRWQSGSSSIFMAPSLKGTSIEFQNGVFKHEFMHAWHWTSNPSMMHLSERATSSYTLAYTKTYGFSDLASTTRRELIKQGGPIYPGNYSWRAFAKIIPLWIN